MARGEGKKDNYNADYLKYLNGHDGLAIACGMRCARAGAGMSDGGGAGKERTADLVKGG